MEKEFTRYKAQSKEEIDRNEKTTEEMEGIGFWTVQSTRSLNQIQTNFRLLENCTTNCDKGIHEVEKLKKRAIINLWSTRSLT